MGREGLPPSGRIGRRTAAGVSFPIMPIGTSELLIVAVLVGAVAMLALLARPRAEGSYRALQLAGWTLYGVAKYLAAKPATTVPRVALIVVVGLGISLAINAGIDRLFARGVA